MTKATLDKVPTQVTEMFDDVAARYDITNDVLSLGQNWRWRRAVKRAVDAKPGQRILDLAAGTGTSTRSFRESGAFVVACDHSKGMLDVAKKRMNGQLHFAVGDAMTLPFASDTFDAVTISFGLRNVPDADVALSELFRVTKPGGRLVVCEFSTPGHAWVRTAFMDYLLIGMPHAAKWFASNPEAYEYLAESIKAWPDQETLAGHIEQASWSDVAYRNLTGGTVALHRAVKRA
jgi:demethylmenaquinone methyltransferase/2-methoxy-6-polyprenyl-1,4-benzoquinol methylase